MNLPVCLLASSLVLVGWVTDPAAATADEPTPAEMVAIFDNAQLPGVGAPQPIAMTGNQAADDRIRTIAVSRGYRLRPVASVPLVAVDGQRVQPAVAAAWAQLRAAAAASGHSMFVLSGFRSPGEQQPIFFGPLGSLDPSAIAAGGHDAAIRDRLALSSAPGYSKHHTGYAIDITQVGTYFTNFGTTASYRRLATDNFRRARRFGFLPSYPDGVADLGPRPEPSELVWVGVDLARGTVRGDRTVVRTGRDFRVVNDDGSSAQEFAYGAPTDTRFLLGNWDGNGTDTLAVRRGNTYHLRNSLTPGPADTIIGYGTATDTILVGDWDGNGTDTFAVVRDGAALLRDALTSGPATRTVLGVDGDEVMIGRP